MPIYEYKCDSCEHQFEELQEVKEDPLTLCPKCDKKTLRRLFGTPALKFNGSGFYVNDYKDTP